MLKISKELFRFLLVAIAGLTVDLLLFGVGIWMGLSVFMANICSATLALFTVYKFAVHRVFMSAGGWARLAMFFLWYAISITAFSFLTQWLHTNTLMSEFQSKLSTVGPSFISNFLAVRTILLFPGMQLFLEYLKKVGGKTP